MARQTNRENSRKNVGSTNSDLKNIFKKSLKLLDKSEHDLREVRKTLKKTVVRLAVAAKGDNEKLNELLEKIKASVNGGIRIDELESGLDEIFVTLNQVVAVKKKPNRTKNETHAERFLPEIFTTLIEKIDLSLVGTKKKSALINEVLAENADIDAWLKIADKLSGYINDNINIVQNDKKDLSTFIVKIRSQLDNIEGYVKHSHIDMQAKESQSAVLREAIDSSVDDIQKNVEDATDISQLKQDIEEHLNKIHVEIETHKAQEAEQAIISRDQYKEMMQELLASREETEKLHTELKSSREKLLKDTLTGLPNRLAYNERLGVEIRRMKRSGEPLCIALWDIDNFKHINDSYGHDAGDRVLKLFANIIVGRTRKVDMFARIGGEEFVLVMPNTVINDAFELNDKLRKALDEHKFRYEDSIFPVTSSVGVAAFDDGILDADSVFKHADKALYSSKNNGKNRCTIYSSGL